MKLYEVIDSAKHVHVDEERQILIVWNGSATFNVYTFSLDMCEVDPTDCFTRYYSEQGYGPGDSGASYSVGIKWAEECIVDWYVDNMSEENNDN